MSGGRRLFGSNRECDVQLERFSLFVGRRIKGNIWFTEGFESPDLKEAKALIDQLSSKV